VASVSLTYAGRDYDRTHALIDHKVEPENVDLHYVQIEDPDQLFRRMISHKEFDSSEFSLSSYTVSRSAGDESLIAIPVFPSRLFRHSYIFCNSESGIEGPQDIVGKKVGLFEWQQSAATWIKGILQHEYDVPIQKVKWVRFRNERYAIGNPRKFEILSAPDLSAETSVDRAGLALEGGEIDALITSRPPRGLYEGRKIRRLFRDWQREEKEFYSRTKLFPIMHTVVVKREILDQNSWVGRSLLNAFQSSKEVAYEYNATHGDKLSLPWARALLEEQMALMGADPYPYGVEANRRAIETFMSYQVEQEIIPKVLDVAGLFQNGLSDT
jgi:4,5-dihydroxyphthalate decarboxylase